MRNTFIQLYFICVCYLYFKGYIRNVTKQEIDTYFTTNWLEIKAIVKANSTKCATTNVQDITNDIYLICIEKSATINNLSGFIRILASNIYRWNNSDFNKENKIFANETEIPNTYIEDCHREEMHQQRMYILEMYRINAEPHELRFLDIYLNKRITTVRGLKNHLNISHHGAVTLLKDFKQKIKHYERKAEIS